MRFYKKCVLLIFVGISVASNASVDSSLKLTTQQWKEISKGVDYTEKYKDLKENNIKSFDYNLSGFKYIFYFLIVGLVIFIIIKIILNFNKNPSVIEHKIGIDSIQEIEEKMQEIDLDKLFKEALEAKNYRIALRINFLIIIKMLSRSGNIIWAKEKTNWEYYSEVKDKKWSSSFKEIIISFESVWYGDTQQTQEQFNLVTPFYESLKKQITPYE